MEEIDSNIHGKNPTGRFLQDGLRFTLQWFQANPNALLDMHGRLRWAIFSSFISWCGPSGSIPID